MVTIQAAHAQSIYKKTLGLIGKREIEPLLIKTRWGIHTIGLRYRIDVVVLDKSCMVVKLSQGLRPNRVFFWNPVHSYILELPEGMIKNKGIRKGGRIKLELI